FTLSMTSEAPSRSAWLRDPLFDSACLAYCWVPFYLFLVFGLGIDGEWSASGSGGDREPGLGTAMFIALGITYVHRHYTFLLVYGDRETYDWGMNVKSCGICYQFSKYDAMDLVPYMCATDDVMSDLGHQGLRRTGTIAVGAHQCDFRYQRKGEPGHLADKYPDRIRILETGGTQ
ncbi:MAG: L-2-amino-thiazoline-4-carboxylic acid hydrolase, partial [Gammaproteobacteria bacterium]|nr:L-2-amino-thiazoline-4-carboxylic acid hydrolase [Gammaproteobacteria bacterium]